MPSSTAPAALLSAVSEQASPTRLLSPDDMADRLGVSAQTLAKWRVTGEGPAFVKVSHKCVRYEQAALDAWVASRRRRLTSEAGAATAADPKAA